MRFAIAFCFLVLLVWVGIPTFFIIVGCLELLRQWVGG